MSSFLIDKNSPIRTMGDGPKPIALTRLRHRSKHSESEQDSSSSGAFQRQNSSSENRKPEFEGSQTSACTNDMEEMTNQPTHDGFRSRNTSMIGYFMSELMKGYKIEDDARQFVERRDRVYTSVSTPKKLEKFCAFGFLQCLDSILYIVTFLPLRIIVALFQVITYPLTVLFNRDSRILDSAQICDLLKGFILIVSCFLTSYMDMSMIYHIVRGQSIIKFYVFYNMLDVMDKLISGFGQDVLDSLYWTAVEPRGRKREHFGTIFHLIFAVVYVVLHTMMILIQAIILNVAFNSHNKNLLTIMLSNNFVELKGNLFKRLDKNNLCQITYSDVKERFHYLVLLLFVLIRNMKELEWSWDLALPFIQDAIIVFGVEIVVDWVKHAFITKFNELSEKFYDDFALGLAQDIASSRKKHAFTDFSDQVCRRMGFTPIPLICLLFMVCSKSFTINGPLPWFLVFLFYLCLVSAKVLNSIILLGWAHYLTAAVRTTNIKPSGTVVNSQVIPKKEDKALSSKVPVSEPTPMPVLTTVDGTTVVDDVTPAVDSPVTTLHSAPNGDNSPEIASTASSSTPSVSPAHSIHDALLTSSIDDILDSSPKEPISSSDVSLKPHQPLSDVVPFSDLESSQSASKMDELVKNMLDEVSFSRADEEVPDSDTTSLGNLSERSASLSSHHDEDKGDCGEAAEPFMFKLSNSMSSMPKSPVCAMTKDISCSLPSIITTDSAVASNIQDKSSDDTQQRKSLSSHQVPIEKSDCIPVSLEQQLKSNLEQQLKPMKDKVDFSV